MLASDAELKFKAQMQERDGRVDHQGSNSTNIKSLCDPLSVGKQQPDCLNND